MEGYLNYGLEYRYRLTACLDLEEAYVYHSDEQQTNIYAGWQDDYLIPPDPWDIEWYW